MSNRSYLETLSKEQLMELIDIYSKNWLAMDGVWFQTVERKFGMNEAMYHDEGIRIFVRHTKNPRHIG